MALQSFVDRAGPVIAAAWLNAVDVLKETVFANAATKAAARTALTADAAFEIANGGTGQRSAGAAYAALYAGSVLPAANGGTGAESLAALGMFGPLITLAAATTTSLGAVAPMTHSIYVTGSGTTITSFGEPTDLNSAPFFLVRFAGACTLTHSSTLMLPGAADITTAAGDTLLAEWVGDNYWRVWFYQVAAAVAAPTYASTTVGTFTTTWTGFSTPPIYTTIKYTIVGGPGVKESIVSISIPIDCFGTSNSAYFSMSIPTLLNTNSDKWIPVVNFLDNGANACVQGGLPIDVSAHIANLDSKIQFARDGSIANWTASGNKGPVKGAVLVYSQD